MNCLDFPIPYRKHLESLFDCRNKNYMSLVENIGVEPMTSCVQGRRSSQLS